MHVHYIYIMHTLLTWLYGMSSSLRTTNGSCWGHPSGMPAICQFSKTGLE